jgi:transposase
MEAARCESTAAELGVLSTLLDLEEFEVVDASVDRGTRLRTLTLVPRVGVAVCPHCRGVCDEQHVCRDRTVLDLPMGGWRTELTVRLWQFRCRRCDRFFTPPFAALAEGAHATERLLERLGELIAHSDVGAAAQFFGIAEKTAEAWYYAHRQRKQHTQSHPPLQQQPVRSLGIDELSLKKDTDSSVVS